MVKELCSFRGDKNKFNDFVSKVKTDNKIVWGVLEPFIDEYLKAE